MFSIVLTWLSSSVGKFVAKWSAILAAAGVIYWKIQESGRAKERAKRAQETLKATQKRKEIDDEVNKMSDDDVKSELSRWVRDNG